MILYRSYKIIIEKKVQKFLEDLKKADQEKIISKIKALTTSDSSSLNIKKLQGYKNVYRLKIDDYRVVFAVVSSKKILIISVIGHRKEVYDIVKRIAF